jgi:hypothetical protein
MRRRDKKRTCTCSGYNFPHSNSSMWSQLSTRKPTDVDYAHRYGTAA